MTKATKRTKAAKQKQELLRQEVEFYNKNKAKFMKEHPDRILLIKEDKLIASFESKDEALAEGIRQFGEGPFLIRLSGTDTPRATIPVLALGIPCQS